MNNQFLHHHQQELIDFAKTNNLKYLGLFGSHARGEGKSNSDVDLLAEYPPGTSYFDVVRMERELGEKLDKKIDLVSRKYISQYVVPYINHDIITIYDQK